jgi:hypothetical protein
VRGLPHAFVVPILDGDPSTPSKPLSFSTYKARLDHRVNLAKK